MDEPTCSLIEDGKMCGLPVHVEKYGWCRKHHRRYLYAGDPLAPDRRRIKRDPETRFLEKVDKSGPVPAHRPDLGPCWLWTDSPSKWGYGKFLDDGKLTGAHRWSYEHFKRPIPDGLEIDHVCHPGDGSCPWETCLHRRCVNPEHLQAVTHRVNTLRGYTIAALNGAVTHCPKGHPYDEENTYVRALSGGGTGRWCKQCARDLGQSKRTGAGNANAAKTHCPHGHPYDEENTFYMKDGGGRRCKICMKATWTRRNAKVRAQRLALQAEGALF